MFLQITNEESCPDWIIDDCGNIVCGNPVYDLLATTLYTTRLDTTCAAFSGWWFAPGLGMELFARDTVNGAIDAARVDVTRALDGLRTAGLIVDSDTDVNFADGCINLCITVNGPSPCVFEATASINEFIWVWQQL